MEFLLRKRNFTKAIGKTIKKMAEGVNLTIKIITKDSGKMIKNMDTVLIEVEVLFLMEKMILSSKIM